MSGLNRINITIPSHSSTAASQRDNAIAGLVTSGAVTVSSFWRYTDSTSGWGTWGYYYYGTGYVDGIVTIATVTCAGMVTPPSGSNRLGLADPGVGTAYTWVACGQPHSIATSGGSSGMSAPAQNSGYNVWNIPGNSTTAATDFTSAITAVNANLSSFVTAKYFKYVDSISGAWQVYAIWFAPGYSWFASGAAIAAPNDNIFYIVTCAGTPNPPTGSPLPAVTIPGFTQTFTTLTGPLSFGPMR